MQIFFPHRHTQQKEAHFSQWLVGKFIIKKKRIFRSMCLAEIQRCWQEVSQDDKITKRFGFIRLPVNTCWECPLYLRVCLHFICHSFSKDADILSPMPNICRHDKSLTWCFDTCLSDAVIDHRGWLRILLRQVRRLVSKWKEREGEREHVWVMDLCPV